MDRIFEFLFKYRPIVFQEGDFAAVIVQKDAHEQFDELLQPAGEH